MAADTEVVWRKKLLTHRKKKIAAISVSFQTNYFSTTVNSRVMLPCFLALKFFYANVFLIANGCPLKYTVILRVAFENITQKFKKTTKYSTYGVRNSEDFASNCCPPNHQIRVGSNPKDTSKECNDEKLLH